VCSAAASSSTVIVGTNIVDIGNTSAGKRTLRCTTAAIATGFSITATIAAAAAAAVVAAIVVGSICMTVTVSAVTHCAVLRLQPSNHLKIWLKNKQKT
jgi:O-phosphoseryl-tRNA(Cys) synthetase